MFSNFNYVKNTYVWNKLFKFPPRPGDRERPEAGARELQGPELPRPEDEEQGRHVIQAQGHQHRGASVASQGKQTILSSSYSWVSNMGFQSVSTSLRTLISKDITTLRVIFISQENICIWHHVKDKYDIVIFASQGKERSSRCKSR